jgi:hypothetical protein
LIVIIPPRMQIGAILPDPKRFPHVPVLDFSDAKRYPELFEGRHRYDFDHLNFLGAAVFSRLLAARILELGQDGFPTVAPNAPPQALVDFPVPRRERR